MAVQRIWKEDEEKILRTMAGTTSARTIAITLNRTRSRVLAKIRALGIQGIPQGTMGSLSETQRADLEHLEPGVTGQQFADAHGMRLGAVRYWARKLGVKFRPSWYWTEAEYKILREAEDIETAMAQLGRSRRVVYDQARLIGVKLGGINRPGQTIAKMRVIQPARKVSTMKPPARYRTLVWSCGSCHSPVSNWEAHYSRMPQCRMERAG